MDPAQFQVGQSVLLCNLPVDCLMWIIMWIQHMDDVCALATTSRSLFAAVRKFSVEFRPSARRGPLTIRPASRPHTSCVYYTLPNGALDGIRTEHFHTQSSGFYATILFWNGNIHGKCRQSVANAEGEEAYWYARFTRGYPWTGCMPLLTHSRSYERGQIALDTVDVDNKRIYLKWYPIGNTSIRGCVAMTTVDNVVFNMSLLPHSRERRVSTVDDEQSIYDDARRWLYKEPLELSDPWNKKQTLADITDLYGVIAPLFGG